LHEAKLGSRCANWRIDCDEVVRVAVAAVPEIERRVGVAAAR